MSKVMNSPADIRSKLRAVGAMTDRVTVITLAGWGSHPLNIVTNDYELTVTRTLRTIAGWVSDAVSGSPYATVDVKTLPNGVTVADARYYVRGCPNTFRIAFTDSYTPELRNN